MDEIRRPRLLNKREGNMGWRNLAEARAHSGGVFGGGTVTRTREATGEALHAPWRNRRSKTVPITDDTGKWSGGVRVADGSVVAMKLGNAGGAKGPC
jgi:hypothetical protein